MQKLTYSYEVLIGDDASTDGTQYILREYAEQHSDIIQLFLRKENLGATKNSYMLAMKAKGKYVAILEGDDYWTEPLKLQNQLDFLEGNPSFVGTCHRFSTVDSYGNPIKHKLNWVKHKKVFTINDFQGIYMPSQPSTFVRRNIYLDKSRDYSFLYKIDRMISDRVAMVFLLSIGNFYCFDDVMGVYRITTCVNNSSITQARYKNNPNAIEQDLELTTKLEDFSKNELGIQLDFTAHRKNLYASAIIRCIRLFSMEHFELLGRIRGKNSRILFVCYAVIRLLKNYANKI